MDNDYRLFTLIVAGGSLSAAARAVGLSPAMVSKRLARLEAKLGTMLIIRNTRRLELTEAGARFHDDITAVLAAADAAEQRASGLTDQPSGPLRISAPTSFGRLHIAPFLKRFLDSHPLVDLELNLSDRFEDLLSERIDLAVRITADIRPSTEAQRLATSQRILCAAPLYISEHGAPDSIPSLTKHRIIAANGQLPWRLHKHGGRAVIYDGQSHVRTNSSEVIRELALSGVGIALRSLWDISDDLATGRLVRILDDYEGSSDVGIYAVTPRRAIRSAAADAFAAFLTDLYSPVPPWG
jgi:DNA-binding transcriptional LysR family regulator